MRRSIAILSGLFVSLAVSASCSGGSGGSTNPGTACGQTQCNANQVCCIDCDAHGTCGPAGTSCPGYNCPLPDSGADGASTGGASSGGTAGEGGSQSATGGTGGMNCQAQGLPCSATQPCCGPLICVGTCMTGVSDRNLKRDIDPVEPDRVLEALSSLPISTWSYTTEANGARHIGPMAQDFKATFHVGSSDKLIMQVDADGVALAAIQALNQQVKQLERENRDLSAELTSLRAEVHRSKR